MVNRNDLLRYIDELLAVGQFKDYCPNGLQVEGAREIRRIVSGVTASQALIDIAAERRADLLLVHHGFFWKGEDPRIVGMKGRRIAKLLSSDINLAAYHLPLDAHPELGNNAGLGRALGLPVAGRFGTGDLAMVGELDCPLTPSELSARLQGELGREPLWIDGGGPSLRRIAWCTGAAQSYLEEAADHGADAFISGEISEYTTHIARERGIHYFAAGHHATERFGPRTLGQHLADRFGLDHEFVDVPNPV